MKRLSVEDAGVWLLGVFVCFFIALAADPDPQHMAAPFIAGGVFAALWTIFCFLV